MSDQLQETLETQLFADVPEAAKVLRYDPRTVRRGCESGDIPAIKSGNRWRIPTSWLRDKAGLPAR